MHYQRLVKCNCVFVNFLVLLCNNADSLLDYLEVILTECIKTCFPYESKRINAFAGNYISYL